MAWNAKYTAISSDTNSTAEETQEEKAPIRLLGGRGQKDTEVVGQYELGKAYQDFYVWRIERNVAGSDEVVPLSSGKQPLTFVKTILENLIKYERQRRDRIAGIAVDESARRVLEVLNEHTSVRWQDLDKQTDLDWPELCRGISILASADMCEAGSLRVRLSEFADRILTESQ